jgi:hypothetical protein
MDAVFGGATECREDHQPEESFGAAHFGAAQLGDKRLTARAVKTADAMMRHPGGTLPDKLAKAELLGFYDFANNPKVTHDNVLAAHCSRTLERMAACDGPVLVIHDTTEADYSGLNVAGLGSIGNGHCRGLLLHNVLAFDYANREALGLAGQFVHQRRTVRKGETQKVKREHPQRESRLWVRGTQAVGTAPAGKLWVNLMDRGGDTFESLAKQHELGQFYVVRSKSNRTVPVRDKLGRKIKRKLHGWARKLPHAGRRTVAVAAQEDQPARQATMAVAYAACTLPAPTSRRGQHGDEPLSVWVVHLTELDAPKGARPLEWILLTNVPIRTQAEAWERVDWYECRPVIEELHKGMKTGCGMELAQFTTRKALEVTIAMVSVVSVQLLRLRDLSRRADADATPAVEVIDACYVEALSLWRHKRIDLTMSVKEFLHALAYKGGHLNRKHDRPPGWLVLWRGWMELQPIVEGIRLAELKRSP